MSQEKYIELMIDTSTSWGRHLVVGIMDYANQYANWRIGVYPCGRNERLRLHRKWSGDGIIARITTEQLCNDILGAGVPAVNVSAYTYGLPGIPQCTSNESVMGSLAADHLIGLGLKQFAYFGPTDRPNYVDQVGESFTKLIREKDFKCYTKLQDTESREQRVRMGVHDHALIQWLRLLPKPIGIFTWSDIQGFRIIEMCKVAGINVPNDVAVLSGETDDLVGSISQPSISSVNPQPKVIGFEAAAILEVMLQGKAPHNIQTLVPPTAIHERDSTNTLSIQHPDIRGAIQFIDDNLAYKIGVDELCDHMDISRRTLEHLFRDHLNRSPANEIRRRKIDHAKHLILTTDRAISEISKACGFDYTETFTRAFKRETNETPMQYRAYTRLQSRSLG